MTDTCGDPLIIIETFERGNEPRAPQTADTEPPSSESVCDGSLSGEEWRLRSA